ncbi:hypothetical protein DFH09DRAFT_1072045 [Mycena vulgaris]|nr:hypothetical protein DFH09DRAFT_1072045 [Mycena vulgaris]
MGSRTAPSRKTLEESSTYKPRLSKEEKAKRTRNAVAAHYRKLLAEDTSQQPRNAREKKDVDEGGTAKKLAKRKWDPPKRRKEHSKGTCSDGDDEETPEFAAADKTTEYRPRERSLTVSEMMGDQSADESNTLDASFEDEEMVSQVLTSMRGSSKWNKLLAVTRNTIVGLPSHSSRTPALPSSSLSASSADAHHRGRPLVPRKSWVSPGEWDEPASPSPHAYERMPWPRLFKSLFGPKGDAEPDAEEREELGLKGNEF